MTIPETYRNQDWPRKVAKAVNRLSPLASATGWAYEIEQGGSITVPANTRTQITIAPTFSLEVQQPQGLDMFAGNEIFGNLNDVVLTRFTAQFTPDDAVASIATLEIEADTLGVIDSTDIPILTGAGVAERLSWLPVFFVGSQEVVNGVRLFITVDGPGVLSDPAVLPIRLHRGR